MIWTRGTNCSRVTLIILCIPKKFQYYIETDFFSLVDVTGYHYYEILAENQTDSIRLIQRTLHDILPTVLYKPWWWLLILWQVNSPVSHKSPHMLCISPSCSCFSYIHSVLTLILFITALNIKVSVPLSKCLWIGKLCLFQHS